MQWWWVGKPVAGVVGGLQAAEWGTGGNNRARRNSSASDGGGSARDRATGRGVTTRRLQRELEQREARRSEASADYGEELGFYRKYTEGLLRRYVQMTMEAGRVSSMMGREVLGGRASSYRIHGFDDAVIFRLDVEKCLRQLEPAEQEVIRRIAVQEYTHLEAAELIGISLRTVGSRYSRALDRLTGILLRVRLLEAAERVSSASTLGNPAKIPEEKELGVGKKVRGNAVKGW